MLCDYWKEYPPVHLLVKGFVYGMANRDKKGNYAPPPSPNHPLADNGPREHVPEFTATEFNELSQLMGGVEIIRK